MYRQIWFPFLWAVLRVYRKCVHFRELTAMNNPAVSVCYARSLATMSATPRILIRNVRQPIETYRVSSNSQLCLISDYRKSSEYYFICHDTTFVTRYRQCPHQITEYQLLISQCHSYRPPVWSFSHSDMFAWRKHCNKVFAVWTAREERRQTL